MSKKTHPRDVRNAKQAARKEQRPTFLKEIEVNSTNIQTHKEEPNEKYTESEFVRKVRELTKGYSKPLEDIMLMYSDAKGTDKMSFEEFAKYEELQVNFTRILQENKNNHLNAYTKLLEGYSKDSDEAIILQGLINELSKEQER